MSSKAKKVAQDAIEALAAGKPYPTIHICNGGGPCMISERGAWTSRPNCGNPGYVTPICPACDAPIEVMTSADGRMQCRRCRNWFHDPNAPKPTEAPR